MSRSPRAMLRDWRYALPGRIGPLLPKPDLDWALRRAEALAKRGIGVTLGYFHGDEAPAQIATTMALAAAHLPRGAHIAVKAPPLAYDPDCIAEIARSADEAGVTMIFDAHGPAEADATIDLAASLAAGHPGTGLALPARWQRSAGDAARLRDACARLRLVKGEWADPVADPGNVAEAYLDLARQLAGRRAPVGVATHDPVLAEATIRLLAEAGTPCELEQLRGLPSRRTLAVARRLAVPVRVYLPFGPGWWPYAIDKALARPYLPLWLAQDAFAYRRGS